MILFDLTRSESVPTYQKLEIENGQRQFDFLRSVVEVALEIDRPFLSQTVIKALHHHAIACLHTPAGQYRPCEVTINKHTPPRHFEVQDLMDDFVNVVNRNWVEWDAVLLAAYTLWRLNFIHPFINGNGRTARMSSMFVLCVKLGGWLPGNPALPELITQKRDKYCSILERTDATFLAGDLDLHELSNFLANLIREQLASVQQTGADPHEEI